MIIECNLNQVAFYSIFISFLTEKRVDPVAATYFSLSHFISIGNSMICTDIWHKYHE